MNNHNRSRPKIDYVVTKDSRIAASSNIVYVPVRDVSWGKHSYRIPVGRNLNTLLICEFKLSCDSAVKIDRKDGEEGEDEEVQRHEKE